MMITYNENHTFMKLRKGTPIIWNTLSNQNNKKTESGRFLSNSANDYSQSRCFLLSLAATARYQVSYKLFRNTLAALIVKRFYSQSPSLNQ